mgnify:CR=1 FL=1
MLRCKRFLPMILAVVVLISISCSNVIAQSLEVAFTDIKLFLNGKRIDKEILVVNGTSYLPVRAISEALGLEVNWNGNENSIYLKSQIINGNDAVAKEFGILDKLQAENTELKDRLANVTARKLEGKWEGTYGSATREFGVTLTFFEPLNGLRTAEFSFYPLKQSSGLQSGKFLVKIEENPEIRQVELKAMDWIQQPSNYVMVDMIGTISGDYLNGVVTTENGALVGKFCAKFKEK